MSHSVEACGTSRSFILTKDDSKCYVEAVACVGMREGGLCLWDLTDEAAQRLLDQSNSIGAPCQRPTYTTECRGTAVMAGPVVAISVLPVSPAQGKGTLSTPAL